MEKIKLQATLQKDYYKKAYIIINDKGEKMLQSYNTIVCKIDNNNKLIKLWNGYSRTTQKHIIDFCKYFGIAFGGSKKDWEQLDNTATKQERYKIEFSNGYFKWQPNTIFDTYEDAEEYAYKISEKHNYTIGYAINRII